MHCAQLPISLHPKTQSIKPCLNLPFKSYGVSATAFAMHPSGLSLALILERPLPFYFPIVCTQ